MLLMGPVGLSVAVNVGAAVVAALTGFLSTILMARWMRMDDFGFIMVLLLAFNAVAVLDGLRPVVVFESAQRKSGQQEILRTAMRIGIFLAMMVGVGAAAVCVVFAFNRLGLIGTALFAVSLALYFPMSVYWGLLDAAGRTGFTGVARSSVWAGVFSLFTALAWADAPLSAYAAVLTGMNGTLLAIFWREACRLPPPTKTIVAGDSLLRRFLRQASNAVVFNLSAFVLGSIDRAALASTGGITAVGLYSGAYEIATKPSALFRVVSLVLFPEAARKHAGGTDFALAWIRGTVAAFWALCAAAAVAVSFRSELLVLILGTKFVEAADAFGLLMIGFSFVILGYACAVMLNARGNFALQRNCYGVAAVAMALAAWPFASIGLVGVASLYMLSRLVDPVLLYFSARLINALPTWSTGMLVTVSYVGLMGAAWSKLYLPAGLLAAALAWSLYRWVHGLARPERSCQ
jgi:O-antigen/teichoic acid export membrane protein